MREAWVKAESQAAGADCIGAIPAEFSQEHAQ